MPDYLGVDPGVGGGLALINEDGVVWLRAMPDTEIELYEILRKETICRAVIEKVSGWQGGNRRKGGGEAAHGGAPGSHMFTFGESYGICKGIMTAVGLIEGITRDTVAPQTWQKEFDIPKGMEYSARKRFCRDLAQEIYPGVKVTLKTADALLIATYCARRYS